MDPKPREYLWLFQCVKRPKRETEHLFRTSAGIKTVSIYTSVPQ